MATKMTMSWFADDDTCWVVLYNYTPPRRSSSYHDPDDPGEIEFLGAEEELEKDVQGPVRVLEFDDFFDLMAEGKTAKAKEKLVARLEEKAAEEASDFLADDFDEDRDDDDFDDVRFADADPTDTLDIEFDR